MPTEGCWVRVWEHKNFTGRSETFTGPGEDRKLGDNKWPGSDDEIGDDIDSLATGPNAWFEGFEDENFTDSVIRVGPGESIADLDQMAIGDNIDSYRLYNAQPPHW
jgi:hypothetical protein